MRFALLKLSWGRFVMHQMHDFLDIDTPAQNVIPMLKQLYKTECHIFEHQGHHILFNVSSGNFFQIDQVQKNVVEACSGKTLNEILDALQYQHTEKQVMSAFKELFEAGIITDTPFERPPQFALPDRLEIVDFDFDITNDTLLGVGENVAYMDETVALEALALLLKESGRVRRCSIAFRGGEPLLNAPLVEKIIEEGYAQAQKLGKEIRFQVVTDARLLNPSLFNRLQKLGAEVVVKFEVDERPPLFCGQGPYSLSSIDIPDHIQEKQAPIDLYYVLDRHRTNYAKDMQQVVNQYPTVRNVSFASDERMEQEDVPRIKDGYAQLARYVEDQALDGQSAWIDGIESHIYQVFNQKASFLHSGIGVRSLAVAPNGILHPSLTQEKTIGDVWQGIDREKQRAWIRETQVDQLDGCKTCWARQLCGGACRLNTQYGADTKRSTCELVQYKYELAMKTCLNIAAKDQDVLYQRYAE
jgi:radical SAM protein with 4Fe4S-binding SPASM domain